MNKTSCLSATIVVISVIMFTHREIMPTCTHATQTKQQMDHNANISTQQYYTNVMKTVGAYHRVTEKPFVPSGPRGCRRTLTLDDDSLLLTTASPLLLCPNLLTNNSTNIQITNAVVDETCTQTSGFYSL